MKVYIRLIGCDARTPVIMEMSDEELIFLLNLEDKVAARVEYGCMPDLEINLERPSNYETDEEFIEYGT